MFVFSECLQFSFSSISLLDKEIPFLEFIVYFGALKFFIMEGIHKQTLLEGRAALLRTSECLNRTQQTAIETEEIGTTVVQELDSQRETLLRARNRLVNTDYELSRTQQLLRMAQRNVFTNKLLLILIIIMEVCILVSLLYVKFLRK